MASMTKMMMTATMNVLNNWEVRKLLQSNTTFDLVVVEPSFTDVLYGLAAHFNASLVGLSTCAADWNMNTLVGHESSMVLEPLMPMGARPGKTFWDRFYNWYYTSEEWLLVELVFLPKLSLVHDHFFGHLEQSLSEIRHGFSLILLNQHFSLFHARSSVPGMIEVAGFHIPNEVPKLPGDLQRFIDEAEHGVIYFALGVELQSKDLPEETKKMLLESFRLIPQRVIWKFEGEPPAGVADNIYLAELLPQLAILAHPNVKLFISHGGVLSVMEAIDSGVPMLGIPLFFDQFNNLHRVKQAGMAKVLDANDLNADTVTSTIQELLESPEYAARAKEMSKCFRDRPMSPLETAVWWTEYALRNRDVAHIRLNVEEIPLIQYYRLDSVLSVVLRLGFVAGSVIILVYRLYQKHRDRQRRLREREAVFLRIRLPLDWYESES